MTYDQPPALATNANDATIYFGYGSNLWLHQMDQRCPTSKYLGVGRLNNYSWIINDRGYANVIEVDTKDDNTNTTSSSSKYSKVVYGLVYSLEPKDERRLDRNEGVPIAYTKELLPCDFWPVPKPGHPTKVDVSKPCDSSPKMLVYIDRKRVTPDVPKKEYIYRMNQGIKDAIDMGVPKEYVEEVMREFIPEEGEERKSMEEFARSQALQFKDESGVFQ